MPPASATAWSSPARRSTWYWTPRRNGAAGAATADHRDHETVAEQLGREPRPCQVAARCPAGRPSVIENEPNPKLPTSFWITCPSLDKAIARIESAGGVREAQEAVGEERVEEIHAHHRELYGTRVAGVREGSYVKCLHAFTALHLSGALSNAVAEWTLTRLERPYDDPECRPKMRP